MIWRRTKRNARLLSLPVLAAIALLAPAWPGARLSVATGSVEVGRGEPPVWKAADEGDALGAGDRVRTGEDGRAEIALEGSTLRLYPNSMLRLPEANTPGKTSVEMDRGTSLFDVLKRGDTFEVHTPEVVVSVKGTRFGVGVGDDEASVAVYRGVVGVRGESGQDPSETLVHAGFSTFGSDAFQLRWHGSDDPWESWSHGDAVPGSLGRGARHDAALRDARAAALAMAKDLPKGKGDARKHGDGKHAPPAHIADPPESTPPSGAVRDVVTDAGGTLDQTLGENLVEEVVSETTGGTVDLVVTVLDSSGRSGSDAVQLVDAATGNTWILEKDEVKDILQGEDSLPSDLAALLQDEGGEDQEALLKGLANLLK
ncbi:MAG TPA: FecR family protein [Myxococcota bacterium]|nr:FecR family protein [Myxococcota bacterium]